MSFQARFNFSGRRSGGDDDGSSSSLAQPSLFSSPRLSLALANVEGGGAGEMMPVNLRRRSREEEPPTESRSGSENMDGGGSGDDLDTTAGSNPRKKKRYHRHTPEQIQELEAVFKDFPHPDEKQRLELSTRLSLELKQVKFWFQNRRTQMKTQLERHENTLLRQVNDKLREENEAVREAIRRPICGNCDGEISLEEQQLRIENYRLKGELERLCAIAGKLLGGGREVEISSSNSVYLEMGVAAMEEVVKMANNGGEPLWSNGDRRLNEEEYGRMFSNWMGNRNYEQKQNGIVAEGSKESGIVIVNSSALVETLMDSKRWKEMFPTLIATATTTDVISGGMRGTRNGALQLMHAELQILSPMVPVRQFSFLRFCKQHAEGVWTIVDVSIDAVTETSSRRLPSGCLIYDMPNGYSKVIWVEHWEYDESYIHEMYRPVVRSSLGFGARRWIATLQRQSECLAILISAPSDYSVLASGRRSMIKLAQRMTGNFCAGVCASTVYKWNKLNMTSNNSNNVGENVRVMTRKTEEGNPGEPAGTVLSAATSVWVAAAAERVFEFLRDERLRSEWDILSNGGAMQEMVHIPKSQHNHHANAVSLLRAHQSQNPNQSSSMLILQETCTDPSGSSVVYAPVDIPAMQVVMSGGDSAYVALLPSGFAVVPATTGGSLLTVGFQILVSSLPTEKLTAESVATVNNLLSCTVQKIKAALRCHEPCT